MPDDEDWESAKEWFDWVAFFEDNLDVIISIFGTHEWQHMSIEDCK